MLVDLGHCLAEDVVTHEDSETCRQAQKFNLGCHACGKLECCVSAWNCHDKCSALLHVCGPGDLALGCGTCGRLCHESNADLRCPYYQKKRGELTWLTNGQEMMDTQYQSEVNVPHMTEVEWSYSGSITLKVKGHWYRKGSACEDGYNNCLIDSIRQCLGLECDHKRVRDHLIKMYGNRSDRANVTAMSYLDVESHAQAIISSLYRNNTSGEQLKCSINDFCVIALSANQEGNGIVVGNLSAPNHLVVLNFSDVHFVPCFPMGRCPASYEIEWAGARTAL